MPGIWPFNQVSTQDTYKDAVTAQFPLLGRTHLTVQISNAAVFYKLLRFIPPGTFYVDETEHYLIPVLANFNGPADEGLAENELFGGIMFRSAVAGTPAIVTVI